MKLRKEEKAKDPLVGFSLLSPSKIGCENFNLQNKTKNKGELFQTGNDICREYRVTRSLEVV